jgi:hypothetical protein
MTLQNLVGISLEHCLAQSGTRGVGAVVRGNRQT